MNTRPFYLNEQDLTAKEKSILKGLCLSIALLRYGQFLSGCLLLASPEGGGYGAEPAPVYFVLQKPALIACW